MPILKLILNILLVILIIFNCNSFIKAEPNNLNAGKLRSVSGYIKDSKTGEALVGATVYVKDKNLVSASNQYGFYSISLVPGNYNISFSYVGYKNILKTLNLKENISLNIELEEETQELQEVVVKAEKADINIKKPEMSVAKLDMKTIKSIPAMFGEVDVIKAIQMLPGVVPTAEGSSGFSVRGGGIDQNLILLDEATVYNASHLMGFFSVFNNDAIKDVTLYKGDIPAQYGGRLSSVLDVRMKEGNNKKYKITGGIGLLSSRLTIEGPVINDSTSFLISGRRTYADIFFPLATDSGLKKSILYFYDFNLKLNHQFDNNNRLFISGYLGRDNFGQRGTSSIGFGNKTLATRLNHQFSGKLFANFTALVANYAYSLYMTQGGSDYYWNSSLLDYSLKADFNFYATPENEIRFGISTTYHNMMPADALMIGKTDSSEININLPRSYDLEHGIYISNQQKISDKITLKYGIRFSAFQNIGKTTLYKYDSNHNPVDTLNYGKDQIFNTYTGWEPRLGLIYNINDFSSVKASYSRTIQYMQLASNSNGGMPLDVWFPATPNVKPQKADQFAIGYFRNFSDNDFETSIETFYKNLNDVVDFKDHAQLLMNPLLEGEVRVGKAHSYGAEFLIRKNEGKVNGWISYTYSRAIRQIAEINGGKEYPAPYDKPNTINIVVNTEISSHLNFSANWIYATGTPITFPVGTFVYENSINKIYSSRNGYRMRDYHRLDLSLTIHGKPHPERLWHGELVLSCYNVYGRHNDWMINFVQDPNDPQKIRVERWYLPFIYLPGITYNFNF